MRPRRCSRHWSVQLILAHEYRVFANSTELEASKPDRAIYEKQLNQYLVDFDVAIKSYVHIDSRHAQLDETYYLNGELQKLTLLFSKYRIKILNFNFLVSADMAEANEMMREG